MTVIFLLLVILVQLPGQDGTTAPSAFWVYFSDKGPVIPADDGTSVLSPRSLERRQQVNPLLPVTSRDIPVYPGYIDRIAATGVKVRTVSRWFNAISVMATGNQLEVITALDFVENVEPVKINRRIRPEPETYPSQLSRIADFDSSHYGYAWEQISQLNIDSAHVAGYFGEGVIVLMLDTGFDLDHPVFDSLTVLDAWDFVENDDTVADPNLKDGQANHGTESLSIIAGYAPENYVGPAYRAGYLLAKTEDNSGETVIEEDYFVAGLEWGEALGANVASSSLGYNDWYDYSDMDGNTAITTRAIDYAVSVGMTCVTSIGNEGNQPWTYMLAPADADSVISVGAVTSTGEIAYFSSLGPTFDGRIKPEVCARGYYTWACDPDGSGYKGVFGSSFSAPLIGGAAALILSARPDWTPMMVREALMMTASQADNPDNTYGYGIANVWDAINYSKFNPDDPDTSEPVIETFIVYPNPATDEVNICIGIEQTDQVRIVAYNLLGRQVGIIWDDPITVGYSDITWNSGYLASGVYLIRVEAGTESLTRKLVYLRNKNSMVAEENN